MIDFATVDVKRCVAPERAQEAIGFVLQNKGGKRFSCLGLVPERHMRQVLVYKSKPIFHFANAQLRRENSTKYILDPMIGLVSRAQSDLGNE